MRCAIFATICLATFVPHLPGDTPPTNPGPVPLGEALGRARLLGPLPPPVSQTTGPRGAPSQTPFDEDEPRYPDLQVLLIVAGDDPGSTAKLKELEQEDGPFERLRQKGWRVGAGAEDNLRIVRTDDARGLVEAHGIRTFPAVVAVHAGEVIRSFTSGCTTPLDEYTFEWLRTGVATRPATAPRPPAAVATTGHYPLRGGHWSVDGEWYPSLEHVLRHLRGPNHNHLIPADWEIESWSYEELRSLHDDLHETGRPRPLEAGGAHLAGAAGDAPSHAVARPVDPSWRWSAGRSYSAAGRWPSQNTSRNSTGSSSRSTERRLGSPAHYVP
jgi:hypothetical protein